MDHQKDGVVISVKVVPDASCDRIMEELGDALKISVSKPPSGAPANKAVVELLADWLRIGAGQVQIVKGHFISRKEILISGIRSVNIISGLGRL